MPPKFTPWYPFSRPIRRKRCACPRTRWYASAIFSAESADSDPELVKKTRENPGGATRATRSANSNAIGWPMLKVGAKSMVSACFLTAATIFGRQWPAFTHHSPEVLSKISLPSGVQ